MSDVITMKTKVLSLNATTSNSTIYNGSCITKTVGTPTATIPHSHNFTYGTGTTSGTGTTNGIYGASNSISNSNWITNGNSGYVPISGNITWSPTKSHYEVLIEKLEERVKEVEYMVEYLKFKNIVVDSEEYQDFVMSRKVAEKLIGEKE